MWLGNDPTSERLAALNSNLSSSQNSFVGARMSGACHRRKGDRIEREVVDRHKALGIHAERYPLSGASKFRSSGHDIDVYLFGRDQAPAVAEVKGRKNGAGFATLEKWLAEYDALFLRRNNADPLVLLPWRMWARILERVQ
jgi:hypothetical protein